MKRISVLLSIFLITIALIIGFQYKTTQEHKLPAASISMNSNVTETINNPIEALNDSTETIEQHIYKLVKTNVADDKTKEEVFGLIKGINWVKLKILVKKILIIY
jgi:hypothetical protein